MQEELISTSMEEVAGGLPVPPPSALPSLPLRPLEELMTKLDTKSSVSKAAPDSDFTFKAKTHLGILPSSSLPSSPPMESSAHIDAETHLGITKAEMNMGIIKAETHLGTFKAETHLGSVMAETHLGILPSSSLPSSPPLESLAQPGALQALPPTHGSNQDGHGLHIDAQQPLLPAYG